jgi:hypothetical protein
MTFESFDENGCPQMYVDVIAYWIDPQSCYVYALVFCYSGFKCIERGDYPKGKLITNNFD